MFKHVRFGFVLTEGEKRSLERLAEIEGGLSEAAMLRRLIRRAAKEQGIEVHIVGSRIPQPARPQISPRRANP